MAAWRVPTLADDPSHPLHPEIEGRMALCPNCHAPFPPSMILDVRGVREATRRACLWDSEMVCSSCVESASILSRVTRAALAREIGAPAEYVLEMAARDKAETFRNL